MPDLVRNTARLAEEVRQLRKTVRTNRIVAWLAVGGLVVGVLVGGGAYWQDRDQQSLLDDISEGALCPFFSLIVQSVQANPNGPPTLSDRERAVRMAALPEMQRIYSDVLDCAPR